MTAEDTPVPALMPTYLELDRRQWARLRGDLPMPLSEADLAHIRGLSMPISVEEVVDVYLSVARLLLLQIDRLRQRSEDTARFLNVPIPGHPTFVIGVAGSVAVGKSTTSRVLQSLLSRLRTGWNVALVTTDGFLFPNQVLEERGLMKRKGFPESYDVKRLMRFVTDVKLGVEASCPVYSHVIYDVIPDRTQTLLRPDVMILEGLNVLQTGSGQRRSRRLISDLLDFSIYVDATTEDLARWYEQRFLTLRDTAFRDPASHFHKFSLLTDVEAVELARTIWRDINEANLIRNIQPTRDRAQMVLEKGPDHSIRRIRLRRI